MGRRDVASSNTTGHLLCVPHIVGNETGVSFICQCCGNVTPVHSLPAWENKYSQDPEEANLCQAKEHLIEQPCQPAGTVNSTIQQEFQAVQILKVLNKGFMQRCFFFPSADQAIALNFRQ